MARTLKVVIDDSACSGKQSCVYEVPAVFRRSDDLLRTEVIDPSAASEAEIVEAALNCPFEAISVSDAETGEHLAP
jgi:ferredoxin